MTVLARSEPDEPGFGGLSMFLAAKSRGRPARTSPTAAWPAARSACWATAA